MSRVEMFGLQRSIQYSEGFANRLRNPLSSRSWLHTVRGSDEQFIGQHVT